MASSRSEAQTVEGVGTALPVFLYPNHDIEKHVSSEERLDLMTSFGASLLDRKSVV